MFSKTEERKIGIALAGTLRHNAVKMGLTIDTEGYVRLNQLLAHPKFNHVTEEQIIHIVNMNEKKRFGIKEKDGVKYIRAHQGHSTGVASKLDDAMILTKLTSPLRGCIHGTNSIAWNNIKKTGLKPMSRSHVHFATGLNAISGIRKSANVIIELDMETAMKDGMEFFQSDNGVVLSRGIDNVIAPKYFLNVTHL